MKKLSVLILCALGLASFASCNKAKKATPGEMAKQHHENLMNRDYDSYVDCICYREFLLPEDFESSKENNELIVQEEKASNSKVLREQLDPILDEKGGIKEVGIKSETVAPDGKSADVVLVNVYNNGDIEELDYHMILDEGDQLWKIKMGPHKEVWKVHTSDGQRESFKLKDFDNKDVVKINEDGDRDFIKEKDGDRRDVSKIKVDGEKTVVKIIDKEDEVVIKEKVDGEKTVTRIEKDENK